jgi:16S rRNA (cytosine967-C5)-methyltransferase
MDINRKTAMEVLTEVETKKAYSNISLNYYIAKNRPETQALVREIVYGVLKNKLYIDYILMQLVNKPLSAMKGHAISILRMGLYQLMFMNSVPEYAAVNESVNLAKRFTYGQQGFVNGVLRSYLRKKKDIKLPDRNKNLTHLLSIQYSYSEWIIDLWLSQYQETFVEDLLKAGNETPEVCIRANSLKIDTAALREQLISEGFEVQPGRMVQDASYVKGSNLLSGKLFTEGYFSVQDESSMIAVDTLDPRPGEIMIDVCAAPGGKTLYAAEKMHNQGQIIAFDIYPHKLELLSRSAVKNSISIISDSVWDGTQINSSFIGVADRVLVDAPCSGLGVVRRKPEIKFSINNGKIRDLSAIQLEILSSSSHYIKPGGTLLYSTCTLTSQENEQVTASFLSTHDDFDRVEQFHLFPNIHGTDGFFICKFIKKK